MQQDAGTACSKQSNSRLPPSSSVSAVHGLYMKKVTKFCRRKTGLSHPVIKRSLCLQQQQQHWKRVHHRTSPLLVINQSSNRLIQKGGGGYAKQKENNADKQRLSVPLEQTQLVKLSLIWERFWLKLSDPLSSSKAISLADISSRGGVGEGSPAN